MKVTTPRATPLHARSQPISDDVLREISQGR